eukprot:CAMPEP_0177619684 /NCGR_PEP_ID=MMETSP0419_2-20121207/26420_1 /TAXON_ID=582737 /ORGANISM="Tetraselmis sp., Strain GSL018" /LENGTH=471 /DNA_ID=CAMNT_0019119025 /DNA_START=634 /DNA_END=2046 /DNA_ORIENTATION=-
MIERLSVQKARKLIRVGKCRFSSSEWKIFAWKCFVHNRFDTCKLNYSDFLAYTSIDHCHCLILALFGRKLQEFVYSKLRSKDTAYRAVTILLREHFETEDVEITNEVQLSKFFYRVNNQQYSPSELFWKLNADRPWPPGLHEAEESAEQCFAYDILEPTPLKGLEDVLEDRVWSQGTFVPEDGVDYVSDKEHTGAEPENVVPNSIQCTEQAQGLLGSRCSTPFQVQQETPCKICYTSQPTAGWKSLSPWSISGKSTGESLMPDTPAQQHEAAGAPCWDVRMALQPRNNHGNLSCHAFDTDFYLGTCGLGQIDDPAPHSALPDRIYPLWPSARGGHTLPPHWVQAPAEAVVYPRSSAVGRVAAFCCRGNARQRLNFAVGDDGNDYLLDEPLGWAPSTRRGREADKVRNLLRRRIDEGSKMRLQRDRTHRATRIDRPGALPARPPLSRPIPSSCGLQERLGLTTLRAFCFFPS